MAGFWGFDQVDRNGLVFMGYNTFDWKRIAPIALELRMLGVPVWYDYGLEAGTDAWQVQISIHIKKAIALVIFVTEGIFKRDNSFAIQEYREAKKLDIPIVPVFLDNVTEESSFKRMDTKYRRYVNDWDKMRSVAYSVTSGADAKYIAALIKSAIDRCSGKNYIYEPWVGTHAEMKRKAEETKERAEREAQDENAWQAAGEKARAQAGPALRVGSRVRFGSYPQNTAAPEPIIWRVLDVIEGKALMISEELLDVYKFDPDSNEWQTSELRAWLNIDFLNNAFGADEQQYLGTIDGEKVTCLSVDEVRDYFSDTTLQQNGYTTYPDRMAKPTAYAIKHRAYVDPDFSTGWWWLRSAGCGGYDAASVSTEGDIDEDGSYVDADINCVRPVVLTSL